MFSDFALDSQWFVAMDSAVEQDTTFTEAVSLLVSCADQAEIDYCWMPHLPFQKLNSAAGVEIVSEYPGRSCHRTWIN